MTGEVVYARILDGETLWLAVRGPGSLTVHGPGGSRPVDTETRPDPDGPLLSARLDVAALLAEGDGPAALTFDLDGTPLAWEKEPLPGPTKVPATRDGRWQLRVGAADGQLRVLRAALDEAVVVEHVVTGSDDDAVELRLRLTGEAELVSLDGDQVLGAVPVAPDGTSLLTATSLPPGRLAVRQGGVTLPVVRRQRDLKRPNYAVALPSVPGRRLQWQPDGQLVLAEEPA